MGARVVADISKCSGCRYCELWCSYKHEGVFSSSLSRIRVIRDDAIGMDYPVTCRHCADATCILACPVGALYLSEEGLVKLDNSNCTKCGSCISACPYGAISKSPVDSIPLICDLCGGDPICVRKCPTNALSVHPLLELTTINPSYLGKQFEAAFSEFRVLLERWGVNVKQE